MAADIILVAALAVFALIGKKRGLFKSLAGILSFVLGAVLVSVFSAPLTDFAKTTPLYDMIFDYVTEKTAIQSQLGGIIMKGATEGLTEIIIKIIVFIVIVVLVRILVKLLNKVFKLPVLRTVNTFGGLLLGLACGFALAYTVFAVWGSSTLFILPKELETSALAKLMFENNILLIFFK